MWLLTVFVKKYPGSAYESSLQSRAAYINFWTPFRAAYNRVNALKGCWREFLERWL